MKEIRQELKRDIERVKTDTYLEVADAMAGWNFVQGANGYPFYVLPDKDRGVVLDDGVDWDHYEQRGIPASEIWQRRAEAISNPYPEGYDPSRDTFDGKDRPMVTLGWHDLPPDPLEINRQAARQAMPGPEPEPEPEIGW